MFPSILPTICRPRRWWFLFAGHLSFELCIRQFSHYQLNYHRDLLPLVSGKTLGSLKG